MNALHYTIAAVVVIIIILVVIYWDKISLYAARKKAAANTQTNTTTQVPPVQLDYNKLLKKGVIAPEVKKLQEWLAITQDGNFGPITETALYQRKGRKEITLNQYATIPDVGQATPQTPFPGNAFGFDEWDISGGNNSESLYTSISNWFNIWM